ncbi:MAG: hypothetical protein BHV99_03025 [Clostridium sp. 26_21]|nr:MAG: hypothetical protein BHV99_03025 [Clostridium sp. 26_21]
MENAADALKMAFGVLIFVVAISLSVSTFSNARQTIDSVISYRDKTQDYVYVKKANENNRTVGIESIIPAMYKAYSENYRIEFYKKNNQGQEEPLILYKNIYRYGSDEQQNSGWKEINYLDLEDEKFANETTAVKHLEALLYKENLNEFTRYNTFFDKNGNKKNGSIKLYEEQFVVSNKLFDYFKNKNFEEHLGEYYQEDKSAGKEKESLEINKTKKRVITYVMLDY